MKKETLEWKEFEDKFGFVDSKNNWVIAPQYDDVKVQAEFSGVFDFDMKYFLDGIAIVKVGEKWGLISEKGDWVMEPTYENIEGFYDGFAKVYLERKVGFIDKSGRLVIGLSEDLLWSEQYIVVEAQSGLQTSYGLLYLDGTWAVKPKIPKGLIPIRTVWGKINGKWAFISLETGLLTKPVFEKFFFHFDGPAQVQDTNGKWGWIDEKGKYVIQPQYDEAEAFSDDGLAKVKIGLKQGEINRRGEWVIGPFEIDDVDEDEKN